MSSEVSGETPFDVCPQTLQCTTRATPLLRQKQIMTSTEQESLALESFVSFLHAEIKQTIDPVTCKPIEETNFKEEYSHFDELSQILASSSYTHDQKVTLMSTPTKDFIQQFLSGLFTDAKASLEVMVMTYTLLTRFLQATKWTLRATLWRTVVIVALKLAQKEHGDQECYQPPLLIFALKTPRDYKDLEYRMQNLLNSQHSIVADDFEYESTKKLLESRAPFFSSRI